MASLTATAEEPSLYPAWLFGEWEVRSQPIAFKEPLGERFVDPETRKAIREDFEASKEVVWRSRFYWASLDENGVPVPPRKRADEGGVDPWGAAVALRVSRQLGESAGAQVAQIGRAATGGPVVQFRAYNAAQEVRAFLDQERPQVIGDGDPRKRPVKVTVAYPVEEGGEELVRTVNLRLDAVQAEDAANGTFLSSELFRQVVATDDYVDTVGDFEVINRYRLMDERVGKVRVLNRVVKYLVPGDPLYDEAAGRAVSWADYEWQMSRVRTCIGTPYGEQCSQGRPIPAGSREA